MAARRSLALESPLQLRSAFRLPVSPQQAWLVVEDVPRLARCLPNVEQLTVTGDRCDGAVAMAVGPLHITFHGTARIVARDADRHTITIEAVGAQSARMHAAAEIFVQLLPHRGETIVTVVTELDADGPLARLGHGAVGMAADRFWKAFGERLAAQLRPDLQLQPVASRPRPFAPVSGALTRLSSAVNVLRST